MAAHRKYPWEEWFGRPRTVIRRGVHYHCSTVVMWQQVRNNGYARGVQFRLEEGPDSITIHVLGSENGCEVPHPDTAGVAP